MKVIKEHDGRAYLVKSGKIHRPKLYIMHKSCGWQWEFLHRTKTGHWTAACGRLIFTTM